MRHPTPYAELNAVLDALVTSVRGALRDAFVGAYLQGSFAVGDFDEHSDVDFIVVTTRELTESDVAALQEIHPRIYDLDSEWAKHLEGSYFPAAILRDDRQSGTPLWYLDHGSRTLIRSDHCNTRVVRSVVRDMGIALAGPPSVTLLDPIPVDLLRSEIAATMRDWGRQILADPEPYRNRFYQGYIVLNYSRMLHDLIEGRPGSKRAGAEWAKATLGSRWADLIDRAWACRPDPARSVRQMPNETDFERTLAYLAYIIDQIPSTRGAG